jgi:hypothetical protein
MPMTEPSMALVPLTASSISFENAFSIGSAMMVS